MDEQQGVTTVFWQRPDRRGFEVTLEIKGLLTVPEGKGCFDFPGFELGRVRILTDVVVFQAGFKVFFWASARHRAIAPSGRRRVVEAAGVRAGARFGPKYLYKWWKKACKNLGIEGVDLYGGTKHSTAMGLRKVATPEEIKRAMMENTNKAFERYFRIESDEVRTVYERTKEILNVDQKSSSKRRG